MIGQNLFIPVYCNVHHYLQSGGLISLELRFVDAIERHAKRAIYDRFI